MSPFDPPAPDPREVILQHLRMHASWGRLWYIPDLATVQWLKSRHFPTHQLHYITFRDTNGQRWSYVFLLALTSQDGWLILHGAGGRHTDRGHSAAPSTSSDRPWLHLGGGGTRLGPPAALPTYQKALLEVWKIIESLHATQEGQQEAQALLEALQERLAAVPREERSKAAWKVLQAIEVLPEDRRGKVAWKQLEALQKQPVEQAELYNRAGQLVSSQTVLQMSVG